MRGRLHDGRRAVTVANCVESQWFAVRFNMTPPALPNPDADDREDAELVAAANRGEQAAFEALYRRHRDWIVAVSMRIATDRSIAMDVLSDVVTYWLTKFPGFVLRGATRSFLYPAVRHATLDALRRRRRERADASADLEILPALAEPLPGLDRETSDALSRSLRALPEAQREVILLHFGDRLTLVEVATALEIPIGTVKSRLGAALATLRADGRLRGILEGRGA